MSAGGGRLRRADVLAAAQRIEGLVRRTPVLAVDLGRDAPPGLLLKAEHRQRSGSFKMRGAANAVLGHGRAALVGGHVVAGSSGNHGLAVARLCRDVGARATVVMAAGASEMKAAALRALGAEVVRVPGGVAARDAAAREHAATHDALLVPSSDDELVVAGQGTVALEILADVPDASTVYVPAGGGGLLAGTCLGGGRVRVVGVEPVDARRYALSLAAGHPVEVPPPDTVADGLRGQRPGVVPLPIVAARVDDLLAVTDDEIRAGVALLHRAGIPAEPSAAVALAGALADQHDGPATAGPAVAVVSGGNTAAALAAPDPKESR